MTHIEIIKFHKLTSKSKRHENNNKNIFKTSAIYSNWYQYSDNCLCFYTHRKTWTLKWYILGSSRSLEYHASGFQDGDYITFRVRAENKMGAGEPSKPSDFITLEDRYRYSKP